jgi:hypothetical protein
MVAVVAAGLLVVACATGSGPDGPQSASSAVPQESSATPQRGRALLPSGIRAVGGGQGALGLAADAGGSVWVDGPWQVARLDPATGAAEVWTIADDASFARGSPAAGARSTEGSPRSGVWFATVERIVLFDGSRFAEELVVPARYGGLDSVGSLAVDGDRVWVSAFGGSLVRGTVLEWRGGSWAEVGPAVGPLVVDPEGALWSGATRREPDGSWVTPDEAAAPDDGLLNVVAADPVRGVWGVQGAWLYRFDGARWSRWALPQVPAADGDRGEWYPSSMAISDGGDVWLAGDDAVVRRDPAGSWTTFTTGQGLTLAPVGSSAGRWVVVVGDSALVTDPTGVLRFDGHTFARLWTDPAAAPLRAGGCLNAVSGSEVWVSSFAIPSPDPPVPWQDAYRLARYVDGSWEAGGPVARTCLGTAVAPDGEVWAVTPQGLVRFNGSDWVTVDDSITSGPVAVGPDGVGWALSDGRLVRFDPDGSRTVIGRTPLGGPLRSVLLSSGQPGVVWVGTNSWEASPQAARWDGRWTEIPVDAWTLQMMAHSDGSLWAEASNNETGWLIRYAEGTWSEVPESRGRGFGGSLGSSPTGDVCIKGSDTSGRASLTCYDTDGLTATVALPELSAEVSIGSDGAAWILGDQVARLPDHVLPWPVDRSG